MATKKSKTSKSTKTTDTSDAKAEATVTVKLTKRLPSTMIAPGERFTGDVAPGSQRTVPKSVADKLIEREYAEKL